MSSRTQNDPIRVGINGFGRIGRSVFRAALSVPGIEIVGINDLMDPDDARYLLANDTVMGRLDGVELRDGHLAVGETEAQFINERHPDALPWDELDVDVALECTGLFRTHEDAKKHVDAGAETSIISAPPKGEREVLQVVYGVNHEEYDGQSVVSNASCTTNSVAPVAKVLHDTFGIEHGLLTTVHAYTGSQTLIDAPKSKRRRGRAAAENIVPTTTGAAIATTEVLPELEGRLDGMAVRVPVPNGSVTDMTLQLADDVDSDAVNATLRDAASGELAGVLDAIDEEIVSSDVLGRPHSSIVDCAGTMSLENGFVKVLAWYDNEYGFANRLLDMTDYVVNGTNDPGQHEPITATSP